MMDPRFRQFGADDVQRLIAEYPLAWVLSPGAPAASASLLPMLGTYDADGMLTGLVGHMSRGNPLCALFAADPAAQFLFTGPQGYVSPEHAGRRRWGPTWNYAALRIEAEVRVDADLTAEALDRLVEACERGRAQPWTVAELQERYTGMLGAIIGFEARVTALDGTFKLAQDEDGEVLDRLLEVHPDAPLRAWMERMNKTRLT
ncbi:PaiB family negative transcriptional regulator [Novosphingobium sp. PhB165]|uniref:FMN-binding negative transcriptional regulator n=1 Tax=Novosphingobium sp. PhB165 TaxID=2485105 RepID=UPI001052158A|nr:FMN-binding negative transcriptional regulator [Novosphingobium sp. PhB165]TCM18121.1 PaiB family negative transcriptional regulator [Novosphingobium sp. PhB165]